MSDQPERQERSRRALYLRWRPRRFAEVVGQEHVTRTLRNAVRAGTLAHAYLFCGPRGTGKTSVARILFRAINCFQPQEGEPCGQCALCRAALEGRALDLVEIDAASNRGIDEIRDLREKVQFAPAEARRKLYIVDEAHQLTPQAWDAFLKTLEEPPAHAIFVLATTEAHKIPRTIVSRCQRFDFARIAVADLERRLAEVAREEGLAVEPAVVARIARLAKGGLRDGLSLLDQVVAYAGDRVTLAATREVLGLAGIESVRQLVEALADADASRALDLLGEALAEGADLRQLVEELLGYLRGALLLRVGAQGALAGEFGQEETEWLRGAAGRWAMGMLVPAIRALSSIDWRGRDPVQAQVQVELALVEACAGSEVTSSPGVAESRPGSTTGRTEGRGVPAREPAREVARPGVVPSNDAPAESAAPVGEAVAAPMEMGSHPAREGPGLGLTAVVARWPELLQSLRRRHRAAALYCETARPLELAGNELTVGCDYPAHVRNLSDPSYRRAVEEAVYEVFGQKLRVRFVHEPGDGGTREVEEALLAEARHLFDAEIDR